MTMSVMATSTALLGKNVQRGNALINLRVPVNMIGTVAKARSAQGVYVVKLQKSLQVL